jgi:hypothetical protein
VSEGGYVLKGKLHRVRRGKAIAFVSQPVVTQATVRRPAKVAKMLALAHHLQHAIERGIAHDRADVARRLGLTRARVTQLLDLLLLAPDIQESILSWECDDREPATERAVRAIASRVAWSQQRQSWISVERGVAT